MRRKYDVLRKEIIKILKSKPKTLTTISKETSADIRTVKRHLLWLEKIEEKVKKIKKGNNIVYKLR